MAAGICPICDAATGPGDRFCSRCGADLDSSFIDLDDERPPAIPPGGPSQPTRKGTATVLVGIALIAAMAWWTVAGGDGPGPSAVPAPTNGAVDPMPSTPPDPPDRSAGTAPTGSAPAGTRADVSRPAMPIDPIDLAVLSTIDATHLAVAGDERLYLLDLASGLWARRDLQNTPTALYGVDGGVVMTGFIGGRLSFAPADGGDPIALGTSDNELLFVDERSVVVRRWSTAPPEILRVTLDGRQRWSYRPPEGTSTIGVATGGEVIVQAAQAIIGVDPATGTTRAIAEGAGYSVATDLLLVWSCAVDLSCRTDQVRLDTSDRRFIADGPLMLSDAGPDLFQATVTDGASRPPVYRMLDGWLELVDETGIDPVTRTPRDGSGTQVTAEDSTLVFRSADGAVLATITSPIRRGVTRVALIPGAVGP